MAFAALSFAVLSSGLLVAGCQQQPRGDFDAAEVEEAMRPDQESWDVHYVITEVNEGEAASQPRLALVAGYMARYEVPDSTYLLLKPDTSAQEQRVRAYLFDAAGDSSAVVVADQMRYLEAARRFEAWGEVEVETQEGRRLESERLHWFEDTRQLTTEGFVRITTEHEQIQGYDLVADEDLEAYTLARVTGQVTVEDS